MRHPIGQTGSNDEFTQNWYVPIGGEFGNNRGVYFHTGVDYNLRTGGDTDLGQELKSISKGKVIYYHYASHPTTGYGRHLVIKIDGLWGSRWVMYSHMLDTDFIRSVQDVSEGQIIGRVGKSGTQYAHLDFSIFKVDPATLPQGIDTIAKTTQQLNDWWEDPMAFIKTWMNQPVTPTTPSVIINDQALIPLGGTWGYQEVQAIKSILNDQTARLASQMQNIADLNLKLNTQSAINSVLNDKINRAIDELS